MTTYGLYLESGPRKQKTMVHVLDLLGCIANGPTTDAALAATPDAIRRYLRFLARHRERIDPDAPFTTAVAEHVTEGQWLGNGSPQVTFQPDLQAVAEEEIEAWTRRLGWLRAEVLGLVRGLPADEVGINPPGGGRTIEAILHHILGANRGYLASGLGRVPALWTALNAIEKGQRDLREGLEETGQLAIGRIRSMTADERSRIVQHGKETWTARKMLRRMLEHEWEHLVELRSRLGVEVT